MFVLTRKIDGAKMYLCRADCGECNPCGVFRWSAWPEDGLIEVQSYTIACDIQYALAVAGIEDTKIELVDK